MITGSLITTRFRPAGASVLAAVFSIFLLSSCAVPQTRLLSETPDATEPVGSADVRKVLESAKEQTRVTTGYTQKYFSIAYPNGDVPEHTGACTDVVIRSFRAAGVDLQKEVHEDMKANFSRYPQKWGLKGTDSNIDHRRVPNLRRYFEREGKSLPVTDNGSDYLPGDVVTWDLNGRGLTHIGVVSNVWNSDKSRFKIIHNIGGGTSLEDVLFDWAITGRYRYFD